jgi:hypothetical protein
MAASTALGYGVAPLHCWNKYFIVWLPNWDELCPIGFNGFREAEFPSQRSASSQRLRAAKFAFQKSACSQHPVCLSACWAS